MGPQNHHPKIEGLQKGSILRLSPSPNPSPSRAPGLKIERDPPFPKIFSSAFPTVPVEADKTELLPSVAPRAKTARVPRQSPTLGFQRFAASPMTYKSEGLRKAFDLEARGSRVPISPRSQNRKIEKAPSAISPSILLRPAPVRDQCVCDRHGAVLVLSSRLSHKSAQNVRFCATGDEMHGFD